MDAMVSLGELYPALLRVWHTGPQTNMQGSLQNDSVGETTLQRRALLVGPALADVSSDAQRRRQPAQPRVHNLDAYITSATMNSTLCSQSKIYATNGSATVEPGKSLCCYRFSDGGFTATPIWPPQLCSAVNGFRSRK
ncbi:hypothetical protein LSAT2_029188 [Lamellibrachia satsuma]|nr:hypothetical protein LSAT2_029188 [Lamellibrachia satsuma]